MYYKALIILAMIALRIFSKDSNYLNFCGMQDGRYVSNTYLSDSCETVVEAGKEMILEAGVTILCDFSSIQVFGKIICKGTEENPIVFKSVKSGAAWRGIHVKKSGSIDFTYVIIEDAIIGLDILDSASIINLNHINLEKCEHQLTMGSSVVDPDNSSDYVYGKNKNDIDLSLESNVILTEQQLSSQLNSIQDVPEIPKYRFPKLGNTLIRVSLLSASVTGIVGWMYYKKSAEENLKKTNGIKNEEESVKFQKKYERDKRTVNIFKTCFFITAPITLFSISYNIF